MTFGMLISVFLIVCAFVDVSNTRHIGQEIIQVTQHSAKPRSKRSADYADNNNNIYLTGTDFPISMQFTLHLNSGDKVLNLEKQRTPQEVTVTTDDEIIKFDEAKSQYAVYQDVKTHSVMIVDCSHSVEFCTLDGSFYHLGSKFNIKPVNNSLTNYNVTKAPSTFKPGTTSTIQSHMSREEQLTQELLTLLKSKGDHSIKKRSANIATTCNHLEVEVCADASVWNYFKERYCNNELAAKIELKRHYLALFSEVDLRYKCLDEEGICFRVVLSRIGISPTDTSTFGEDADNDGFPEGEAAIHNCRLKTMDPHVDYFLCFTRVDLEYEHDSDFDAVSYFEVICNPQWPQFRVGVSEDLGDDTNLIIASLILGAIGIDVDGENNNCNGSDLFISSELHPPPHIPIISNPWMFSQCAIDDLNAFLPGATCLRMGEISDEDFEEYSLKDPFPGQIFDLDYQCQLTYGLDSEAVVGPGETSIFDVDDICYKGVWCSNDGDKNRSRVYNGSPCGCKKICIKNICVREFNIPLGEGCEGCCECEDDNAICDCETKTCICDEGFYDSNLEMANGTCEPLVPNNETCPFDEACEDMFAECDNNTHLCVCIDGYVLRDEVCVRFCENSTLTYVSNSMWHVQDNVEGSIANLKCNDGYKATTIDTCSVCGADGSFSAVSVYCQRDCGCPPQTDNNGVFNLTVEGDTCLGDTAKLYCCPGYDTQYEVIITCEDTAQGWSNASEECTINECTASSLPWVDNGEYVIKDDGTVGQLATLVCEQGYVANSNDTCAVCENDGYFSSVSAICIRDCKCPPTTPNGDFVLVDPHDTTEGAIAILVCATGFEPWGAPIHITCENTTQGWTDPAETCEPVECDESALPYVSNGMYVQQGNQSGNIAQLECNENYTATSTDTCIVCLPNGTYSSASAACIYDCGCPPETPNGFFSLDDHDNTTDGATASLICNTGYNTSYPQTITCDEYEPGWTDTSENCTIIECPDNLLPSVNNGSYNSIGNEVGNVARLECDYGFEPTSVDTCSVCGTDGNWSPASATCKRNCGCPPETPEGDFVLDNPPDTCENATATLVCATGFGTPYVIVITCENTDAGWTDASQNCSINICPNSTLPSYIYNGGFVPEGNEVGDLAKLECDDGYVPTSDDTCVVCQPNEEFSYATAECVRDCECPPEVENGIFTLTYPDNTTEGAEAVLVCDTGYETSVTVTITCENTTQGWTDVTENCTLIECHESTLPYVNDGAFVVQGASVFGAIATLSCNQGYVADSEDTCSQCLANGSYSAATADCCRDCKCPPQTPNGQFVLVDPNETKEDAEATLECDEGYETSYYPVTITCENTAQGWSDASQNCTIKTCPANTLPSVNNGSYVPEDAPYPIVGTVATLVCEDGYVPDSDDTCAVCLPSGSYSQPTAICKRDCKCPPVPDNGVFVLDAEDDTCEDATATLSCADGYNGYTVITCEDTAQGWSSPGDTCELNDCEGTPSIDDGDFNPVDATTVGGIAKLTCDYGFSPSNDHICISCLINGSWSAPAVSCVEDCGELPEAENGEFNLDEPGNSQLEATATLTCCPDSYVNSPPVKITCESGGWSDPAENCTLRDCMSPPYVSDGGFVVTGGITTVGGTATLTCDEGYKLDDEDEICIYCLNNGNWSPLGTGCKRDCGCPPVPPNGAWVLNAEGDTCEDAIATLTCADGYETDYYPITIVCEDTDDGWTDQSDNCTLIECDDEDLPSINFGDFTSQGNTPGSKALLTCDSGYSPNSTDICIACQLGGAWSSTSTICVADCGQPPSDNTRSFTLNSGTQEGDTASIVCCCNLVAAQDTITCSSSGEWEDLDKAVCRGCPSDDWVRRENTCYLLNSHSRKNSEAVHFCDTFDVDCIYDSNLVKYDNMDEREFVRNLELHFHPQPQRGFWNGLYQNGSNGPNEEYWFPSEKFATYTDWDGGQPNDLSGGNFEFQRCTCDRKNDHYRWHDLECLNQFNNASTEDDRECGSVCEIDLVDLH